MLSKTPAVKLLRGRPVVLRKCPLCNARMGSRALVEHLPGCRQSRKAGALQTGLLTVEEFLKLPEPKEGHLELHHGEVVEMPPLRRGHQRIQNRLQTLLQRLVDDRFVVHMEMAFRPTREHEVWVADVGCVSRERDEATGDDDYLMGGPEIVIEVLSPGNTMDDVLDRQDICLNNGSVVFWTVDPKRKAVMCITADRVTSTYNSSMKAPLPPTIAESSIDVADIFK